MIYSHEDALIDTRETLQARAEYLLKHHLEQRERYASMRASSQLLIDMGRNSIPLDLDVQTPREELVKAIETALLAHDEAVNARRTANAMRRR